MKKTVRRGGKKQEDERPIFGSIRKPVAPPGHVLSQAKPDERARPARRKVKHKNRVEDGGDERAVD